MMEKIEKGFVSAVLVVFYLFLPTFGYGGGSQPCCGIEGHLLYSFCHVNVWHLVGNIACLWAIRGRYWWFFDYVIAVLCSFLPVLCFMSVCGASCVVFAEIGRRFGRLSRAGIGSSLWLMCKCVWPAFVIGAVVPGIAVMPHLWALLGGYLFVCMFDRMKSVVYGK